MDIRIRSGDRQRGDKPRRLDKTRRRHIDSQRRRLLRKRYKKQITDYSLAARRSILKNRVRSYIQLHPMSDVERWIQDEMLKQYAIEQEKMLDRYIFGEMSGELTGILNEASDG